MAHQPRLRSPNPALVVACLLLGLLFLPLGMAAQKEPPLSDASQTHSPEQSTPFQFTKVDLDLLREVDGFDRYIEEQGWVYADPKIDGYLTNLGMSLAPSETPEHVQWHFRILRDIEVNAFALPNGSIYVNSALLARLENEAQLAGVLAHEITHVVNRHSYLANRSARKKAVAVDIILSAASAAYFAGASPAIVTAMGNLIPMILESTIFGYSRHLEREADVYAVAALERKGYDLHEFARGFQLLRAGPEVDLSQEPVFWSSHPKLESRVEYINERAEQLQPHATGLQVNEAPYRSATMGVIRHHAALAMMLGRPRTALAIAQRLIAQAPDNAENYVLLGDAYRSLGARRPLPTGDELSDASKQEARKRLHKMTIAEYDEVLLKDPEGPARCQANVDHANEAFQKALALDPQNATAHRGLGLLFERDKVFPNAIAEFQKYLELAPNAKDARQFRMRLQALKSSAAAAPQTKESQAQKPAPPH